MNSLSKKIKFIISPEAKHWVGNGFNVHNMLRPTKELYESCSPFLLMDYAPPKDFAPTENRKGVGEHPHRGFETVTFALQGEVEHRDSSGGGGIIGPGDVQWMTAGSGVVHDEFHSNDFSKKGGTFEMIQLWVNLPSKFKMTPPKYQGVSSNDFPLLRISNGVELKVVAGKYENELGPCTTYSPINVYNIDLDKLSELDLKVEENTNTLVFVIDGEVEIDSKNISKSHNAVMDRKGDSIKIKANLNTKLLVLNAEPIDEPVVSHGPFVMNTQEEIYEAILDFQSGTMGTLR